jgi:2-keto-4-pentenoate hydratase/2-oxohepta-3-ene-1,7-dioic acid hydratase in catechol pathway
MKLVSYEKDGRHLYGAVVKDGIVDLYARLGGEFPTLRALLEANAVDRARKIAETAATDCALAAVKFDLPIPNPDKILCIGVNYAERNEEYKDGSAAPKYPSVFPRFPGSFVGHGRPIMRPPESIQLDYDGEIAIVIGKGGRRIPEAQAESHIGGLTMLNEGTIRDWVRHGKFNVTQGKNWQSSGAIGPWIVTADEFSRYDDLQVTTRVNGELRQQDTTARLMFSFRHLIHYLSTWTALKAGDVIATGTPTGAGVRFEPPKFLKAGDVVEVECPSIATLRNVVEDERV